MAPRRYTITPADVSYAHAYLTIQLQTYALKLRQYVYADAAREFEIPRGLTREARADRLNRWCEQFLSSSDWTRLKSAIRKRRQRRKGETKVVTISQKAHKILRQLSKRDHATHSATLEHYLGLALRSKPRVRP